MPTSSSANCPCSTTPTATTSGSTAAARPTTLRSATTPPQDSDWLLIEVSDDEDGTLIDLAHWYDGPLASTEPEALYIETGAGQTMYGNEIENVDASGNLYGFLDDVDVAIGGGGHMVDGENVGIGSSAQLEIRGSVANNVLIGGFDNDLIIGRDGNDLLMGGNLNYLNNPNLLDITDNGMDEMYGDDGDDNIVFEADGGIIDGGSGEDTLWLTRESLGTQTAADMTDRRRAALRPAGRRPRHDAGLRRRRRRQTRRTRPTTPAAPAAST